MPRTRSLAWKELKLGVMTIAAIMVAAATIFLVMGGKGFWWQRYSLKALFPNVQGLNTGSPVRVAGKEVGSVLMPAGQSGSPMPYMVNGKQYIIVAVSGGNYSGDYIAYSLPNGQ